MIRDDEFVGVTLWRALSTNAWLGEALVTVWSSVLSDFAVANVGLERTRQQHQQAILIDMAFRGHDDKRAFPYKNWHVHCDNQPSRFGVVVPEHAWLPCRSSTEASLLPDLRLIRARRC